MKDKIKELELLTLEVKNLHQRNRERLAELAQLLALVNAQLEKHA